MEVSEEDGVLEGEGSTEEVSTEEECLLLDFEEEDSLDKCEEDPKCSVLFLVSGVDSEEGLDMEGFLLKISKILRCKVVSNLEWFSNSLQLEACPNL